jgi:hypothetical protein
MASSQIPSKIIQISEPQKRGAAIHLEATIVIYYLLSALCMLLKKIVFCQPNFRTTTTKLAIIKIYNLKESET